MTIGEPLFVTTSGNESLRIANSSSSTVRIGPVRQKTIPVNSTTGDVQFDLMCPIFNYASNVSDNVLNSEVLPIAAHNNAYYHFMYFYRDSYSGTVELRIGDIDDYDYINNQYAGCISLYYGNATVDMISAGGFDSRNITPNVDGMLLSSGHTEQTSYTVENIPSTWKQIKYNTTDKKLYADDTLQTYTAGTDITISTNTINATQQIPQTLPSVSVSGTNITYTEVQSNSSIRRNYAIAEVTDNNITYSLTFVVRTRNVEHSLVILAGDGAKVVSFNKPIVMYRDAVVDRLVYDSIYPITIGHSTTSDPSGALYFEVIVKEYNNTTTAVLHCKNMVYE